MSDAPRESAVFGGLDAFDDHSTDADAMDHMLLNLAAAASDPADWHIDDFYTPPPPSPPLNYHDATAPASSPDARMQVTLTGRAASKSPSPSDTPMTCPTPPAPATPLSVDRKRPSTTPQPTRSPASSGSSAKPRVPTALCTLCGKNISTNGANFRRHEAACRRQRGADKNCQPPAPQPTSPFPPPPPATSNVAAAAATSRRDSDLLNVVRRLETSIGTLDVSARLCLRDALVSLSNKASNPQAPPTPQQEAMNRAAEYLVLRMLFLSGEQVMHTAPGTAGYPGAAEASQSTPQPTRPPAPPANDGTVAASTGTAASNVVKKEDASAKPAAKSEPTVGDGT